MSFLVIGLECQKFIINALILKIIMALKNSMDNNFGYRFSIRKTYFIFPITNENRTLIKLNLELIGTESQDPIDFEETREYYYKLQNTIINNIINLMEESKDYHFINESFIVQKNQVVCWNNILDINNLSKISLEEIGKNYQFNGDPEKVGAFWKFELKKGKKNSF